MANQPNPIKTEGEEQFDIISAAAARLPQGFLVLCPETSSNYPYADEENTSSEHLATIMADLKLRQSSHYFPVAETPVTAKSEVVVDTSAKARSPSVSSNRSSSSCSTATAAQTPRFLKVCPVHYGRGHGPDDFSPA